MEERYTGDEEYRVAVQKVITPQNAVKKKPSYCYGKAGYKLHSCRFRETICHHCKNRGHLARGYRSKAPNLTGASGKALWRPRRGKQVPVKWLGMNMKRPNQLTGSTPSKPITVEVEINGQSLLMEVDTCCAVSLISQGTAEVFSLSNIE